MLSTAHTNASWLKGIFYAEFHTEHGKAIPYFMMFTITWTDEWARAKSHA